MKRALLLALLLLLAGPAFAQAPIPDEPATEAERLRSYAEVLKQDRDDKEGVIADLRLQLTKLRKRVQTLEQAPKPTEPTP